MILLRKRDLLGFGYNEVVHGGSCWLANGEGARFLTALEDCSLQEIAIKRAWKSWRKRYHTLYLACGEDGRRYLIKFYPSKGNSAYFFSRRPKRARNEFYHALIAYQRDIRTVLPLGVGEGRDGQRWGLVVYPFLEDAFSLTRVYRYELEVLSTWERQHLEKDVGRMIRKFIDSRMYPRDMGLDNFLVKRMERTKCLVYYVDLERVKLTRFLRKKKGIEILGGFLALLEWSRICGGRVNRSSMMRIALAYFHKKGQERLDKRLCRVVIQAAGRYWDRRGLAMKRPSALRIIG